MPYAVWIHYDNRYFNLVGETNCRAKSLNSRQCVADLVGGDLSSASTRRQDDLAQFAVVSLRQGKGYRIGLNLVDLLECILRHLRLPHRLPDAQLLPLHAFSKNKIRR